jgi:hypothetical protein
VNPIPKPNQLTKTNPGKPGKSGKNGLTPQQRKDLNKLVTRIIKAISNAFLESALTSLLSGDSLTGDQVAAVEQYLNSGDCPLDGAESALLRQAIGDGGDSAASGLQTTRYLKVRNTTNQPMTVHVQFGAPGLSNRWLTYELDPGELALLVTSDGAVACKTARVWAETASLTWDDYKDQDLVLVEAPYESDEIDTFILPFAA